MKKYLAIGILAVLCSMSIAQSTLKSGFYLEGMLNRHRINPAVINQYGYIGIPGISNVTVAPSTNMGLSKFIFSLPSGQLTTFMNRSVITSDFLSGIAQVNTLNVDANLDIINFGFHGGGAYHTAAVSFRTENDLRVPYALFDFMKSGMSTANTSYAIENLSLKTTNFIDISYGYARKINDDISVGGRIKFLVGLADAKASIERMNINMSEDKWVIRNQGEMQVSGMGAQFAVGTDGEIDLTGGSPLQFKDFKIGGYGAGIDIGATYSTPVEGLKVSLALVDIGFISWKSSDKAATQPGEFVFDGFKDIPIIDNTENSNGSVNSQLEDLKNQLLGLFRFERQAAGVGSSYTNSLRTTLNVGVEYELVPEIFSFGALSSTRFSRDFTLTELIVSANYKPKSWFNAAVSADISNLSLSWGAVINFCPKFINFFVGADFIVTNVSPQFIPLRDGSPRVSFGLSVPIGVKRNRAYVR